MLRKVRIKMILLDTALEDRSKHLKQTISAMRHMQALAGELKGQMRDAIVDADKHQRIRDKANL